MPACEIEFRSGGVPLAGTLTRPDRPGVPPAVVLLPGSGHHDRDETLCNQKPFRTIARHLATHGIASLRFDSRGMGSSGGEPDSVSFTTKVSDALAARLFLTAECAIPAEQVAYVGHSEGGLVAAAASLEHPTPLAMLAGPVIPIAELLHAQARVQSLAAGATDVQVAHERRMNEQVFDVARSPAPPEWARTRVERIITEAVSNWPGLSWDSPQQIAETAEAMASVVLAEDYRSLLRQEPSAILANVKAPVLALFAELDCQVEAEPNRRAFGEATKAPGRAVVLARHNHLFQVASSGRIDEYETLGEAPSSETLTLLTTWLHETFVARRPPA